ncbi:MAG: starvation/stationary phase protection protein [Bacteroidetes bacterium]|nr:starvation/stationary phase protection protein [Bacteroidota bacterium]
METLDLKSKTQAAQYSLNLIKVSLDHLVTPDAENKAPDVDATEAAMKQLSVIEAKKELVNKYPCSNEMLKELIKDHERIITQLGKSMSRYYERYRDVSLRDLLNRVIEEHKNIAWRLKRYLVA